jgi:Flp pilus assembly protein TadG
MTPSPSPIATTHGSTRRRFEGDDGSVFAEFALALPLLIFLMLGVFEFGMAWREKANLSAALRAAGRVGSSSTDINNNRPADLFAVQAFGTLMAKAKNVTVNRMVIYKATTAGAPTDASCLTVLPTGSGTGVNGACNIFSWSQIQNPGTNFTAACTGSTGAAWDKYWCPTDRKIQQSPPDGPPDYMGYYAHVTYDSYTGMLPDTVTLTDRFVTRIDPKVTT